MPRGGGLSATLLLLLAWFALAAGGPTSLSLIPAARAATKGESSIPVGLRELERELSDNVARVPEFQFVRQEAQRLGVRAWLFGGTASGYAHYVNWDLKRRGGDSRYQPDRFDYDYTNIYRSNQDLDIVIDGTPEQAQKLQALLQEKYPHIAGGKAVWEVRLLREDLGDKLALLNNPDFLRQHTDSNSTGMIELTPHPRGEVAIRDLRDWDSREPHFLRDVSEAKLHYYFSPQHGTTRFFREGRNPQILSVIRYLTKAFQYELELRSEDLARIRSAVDAFDPKGPKLKNTYVRKWIEKNGKKLVQNAVNIEYAVKTMDALGLRDKLARITGDEDTQDSLAWWMRKEPLRTKPVGQGGGETASRYFARKGWAKPGEELVVAHETGNFAAYESITRAHTGDPNVLISRGGGNQVGELAAFGDGFYTRVGRIGAKSTGLTIRFRLRADARLGKDFTVGSDDFVIVTNKAALRVIPESLELTPTEFFEMLRAQGGPAREDGAIWEKLKRRMARQVSELSPKEAAGIARMVRTALEKREASETLVREWLALPISENYPAVLRALFDYQAASQDDRKLWMTDVGKSLRAGHFRKEPTALSDFLRSTQFSDRWTDYIEQYTRPELWKDNPALRKKFLDAKWIGGLSDQKLAQFERPLMKHIFPEPFWADHLDTLLEVISKPEHRYWAARSLLSRDGWFADHPELVDALLKDPGEEGTLAEYVLSHPDWQARKEFPGWVEKLIRRGEKDFKSSAADELIDHVLKAPWTEQKLGWLERILRAGKGNDKAAFRIFTNPDPEILARPELVQTLLSNWTKDKHSTHQLLTDMLREGPWEHLEALVFPEVMVSQLTRQIENVHGATAEGAVWLRHSRELRKNLPLMKAYFKQLPEGSPSWERGKGQAVAEALALFDPALRGQIPGWEAAVKQYPLLMVEMVRPDKAVTPGALQL